MCVFVLIIHKQLLNLNIKKRRHQQLQKDASFFSFLYLIHALRNPGKLGQKMSRMGFVHVFVHYIL